MLSKEKLQDYKVVADARAMFHHSEVNLLLDHIAELEENATAQALALKAAKAMQQAETERADANERDAGRYRYIRTKERMMLETDDGEARMTTTFSSADEFDDAIDQAMSNM